MEDVSQWKRARAIFDVIADLPPAEQRSRLEALCRGDDALRDLVESLLAHDDSSCDPIEQAIVTAARGRAGEEHVLKSGETMLHYGLTTKIGEGGMGVVWKATDFTLGRDVAIKVLPSDFAKDASRLGRFEREAKLLAALNHSNIASVYSLHEDHGRRFLTMEYVEGDDLSARIAHGPMPIPDVLAVALQIADALEEAHEKGIVHRDLKPANVKVKADGKIKVLDFGLAKFDGSDDTQTMLGSSALVAPIANTHVGVILGTAAYMPPEQARGLPVDKRADIWAFGVMLFEMLSGKRPFHGSTLTDVLAAVVTAEPDLTLLPRETPASLVQLISRCLQKDTRQRLRDIGDARIEIERLLKSPRQAEVSRRRLIAGVGAAIIAFASTIGIGRWMVTRQDSAAPIGAGRSLAVLPLVDLSAEQDQEYFADGLSEELLGLLGKNTQLRVVGRASAFRFKKSTDDPRAIASSLGVSTLLEGTVRRSGTRVRITAQLIDGRSGFQLWSDSYDRTMDDLFAVQDEIAQAVAKALQVALSTDGASPPGSTHIASGPAYNAYLRGKHFLRLNTKESVQKATAYFTEAVTMDPAFAPAWAGLSSARSIMGTEGFAPPDTVFGEARRAAERAVSIDPQLADGHLALSTVRRVYDWEWAGANAAAQRALQLQPNNAEMVLSAARLASTLGRLDEALALSRRAAALDPLNLQVHFRLARYEYFVGQLDHAEASFGKVLELNPEYPTAHHGLARVLLDQGKPDAALAELAKEPSPLWRMFGEALLFWTLNRRADADKALGGLIEGFKDTAPSQIATVYAYRGQLDDALSWLERSYAVRDTGLSQLKALPEFRRFEREPRYRAFLDKMSLP